MDTHGKLISHQSYLDLLTNQINEDSKFKDMDNPLTGPILIEKLSDDFNILSQFESIVRNLPCFSYVQYNEMEVSTKEMNAFDYPSEGYWSNITNIERRVRLPCSR